MLGRHGREMLLQRVGGRHVDTSGGSQHSHTYVVNATLTTTWTLVTRTVYNLQRTSGVTIGVQYSLLGVIEKVGAEYAGYMIHMIQVQDT